MGTAHTSVRLRTLDCLVGTVLGRYGQAGQTRSVNLTWLKSKNLVAELAGAFAPEGGEPTPSAQSSVSGGLAGIAVRDHIEASTPTLLPDPVYEQRGGRKGKPWLPRLAVAQAGSPC